MTPVWYLPAGLAAALALAVAALFVQRQERRRLQGRLREREEARRVGSAEARLQYPSIDLQHCIGCGACVRACPEGGVLDVIHGQAQVVHGARCVGHGHCAVACPTGAIALTLGDLSERKDIPVLGEHYDAREVDGLFLAGEVTGFALIRTAVEQGKVVGKEVARRVREAGAAARREGVHDLLIVGAGPAGISCGLQAKSAGLDFLMVDQMGFGGTITRYPRRKLVMTQPVELPLHGMLKQKSWTKEALVELWRGLKEEHQLPVREGETLQSVEKRDGLFLVRTDVGSYRAHNVCLAVGRRGTPRRLGVPGEDRAKVSYSLLDAQSYRDADLLVVGGGDSAVEAAIGLAEQPRNRVTLAYRGENFFRVKARNLERMKAAEAGGQLRVLRRTEVLTIDEAEVELVVVGDDGVARAERIANEAVFVMAGGVPPMPMLEQAGVSFDHEAPPSTGEERGGSGLLVPLLVAAVAAGALAAWGWHERAYYALPDSEQVFHPRHGLLRSGAGLGLAAGLLAACSVLANLCYLLRRSAVLGFRAGSMRTWMSAHVTTGLLALMAAVLHAGYRAPDSLGGHALLAMSVVVGAGALGRYLYSIVPRAANGRELELDEVRVELTRMSAEWDRGNRDFGLHVRDQVDELLERGRWRTGFLGRLAHVVVGQFRIRRRLAALRREGLEQGVPALELAEMLRLAERGYRIALAAAHLEDLRGLLSGWRFLHRWIALFMVLILGVHVYSAVRYGGVLG